MEEKIFYESETVKITSSRFIVNRETYPIANISSVKTTSNPPSQGCGVVLMIFGGLFLMSTLAEGHGSNADGMLMALVIGAVMFYAGWHSYRAAKAQYTVILTTAGSEVKALTSPDKEIIDKVIQGLNDSIVHRG